MQSAGDANLAAAVEADQRTLVWRFEVDWNRNGLYTHTISDLTSVVKSISVPRDIQGTLPAETTMVEGFMSARMTVTVGGTRPGDTSSIAKQLSPWNITAPLFGDGRLAVPVRAWIGHRVASGAETQVRQFTGVINDFEVDSRSGNVTFICADSADNVRAAIDLPLFALESGSVWTATRDYRSNSQWAIDYVFRRNGYYMSPPPQQGCVFSATLHGSMAPEIGYMADLNSGSSLGVVGFEDPVYWPGRSGWGLAYGGSANYVPVMYARPEIGFYMLSGFSVSVQAQMDLSKTRRPTSTGIWFIYSSGSFQYGETSATIGFRCLISSSGQLSVQIISSSSVLTSVNGPTLPLTGYQDVWVRIDLGSPLSNSTVSFPGMTVTGVNLSGLNASAEIWTTGVVQVAPLYPTHDLQMCNATGLAAGATLYDPGTWTPQCDLDTGLNDFSGLPLRRGVSSWDLLKEVVGAEYGLVGFDESGRPFFKNRDTLRSQNLSIEKTIDNRKMISEISLSERSGSVRNKITGSYASRTVGNSSGIDGYDWVFKLKNTSSLICPPGQSIHEIQLDTPGWFADGSALVLQNSWTGNWPPADHDNSSRFTAARQDGSSEQTGVTVALVSLPPRQYGSDRVRVFVTNPGIYPIVFATSGGDPAFWIAGRKFQQDTDVPFSVSRPSSIAKYGERVLELPTSNWHQREDSLGDVSRSLLRDLQAPVPVVQSLTAVGDCRLQLQDSVSVEDTNILGGPMYTSVIGINRTLIADPTTGAAKLVDSLNVRPFAAPGKWILGHTVWGILGQTTKL